jgi:protein phosphatase
VDHSLVAALVERGHVSSDAARQHPLRSLIVRALGLDETVRPDVTSLALSSKDVLLLCSDGLSDALDDLALHRVLDTEEDVGQLVPLLVGEAAAGGSGDDISVIAARLG